MNESTELTISQKHSGIAPWSSRDDVRELAGRLQKMMPGAKALTPPEALSLAQAAVAHELDPFNGELWFLPGSGLMAGIKGHRRAAHKQMKNEGGGNYWPEFEQIPTDQKASLGIPQDALAFRCKIRDTQTVNQYVSEIERLLDKNIPWEVVENIVGKKPYTEGIGYAQPSERSKMTLVQRAMKRAEADALKRRFDLPFGDAVGANGDSDIIDAEFVVEQKTEDKSPEETLEKNRSILHGNEPTRQPRPAQANPLEGYINRWNELLAEAQALGLIVEPLSDNPDKDEITRRGKELAARIANVKGAQAFHAQTIAAVIEAGLSTNTHSVNGALAYSDLTQNDEVDVVLKWFQQYRESRNAGADTPEAATVANAWLDSELNSDEIQL